MATGLTYSCSIQFVIGSLKSIGNEGWNSWIYKISIHGIRKIYHRYDDTWQLTRFKPTPTRRTNFSQMISFLPTFNFNKNIFYIHLYIFYTCLESYNLKASLLTHSRRTSFQDRCASWVRLGQARIRPRAIPTSYDGSRPPEHSSKYFPAGNVLINYRYLCLGL